MTARQQMVQFAQKCFRDAETLENGGDQIGGKAANENGHRVMELASTYTDGQCGFFITTMKRELPSFFPN
jgi:hypothetical protein